MQFNNLNFEKITINNIELLQFPFLNCDKKIIHCFTTRNGGVSEGELATLNLGLKSNDDIKNVEENISRVLNALKISHLPFYRSIQTHSNNVCFVDELKNNFTDVDGLILCNKPGVIMTIYADCVPVYLINSHRNIVALLHSGWKGTLNNILLEAFNKLIDNKSISCEEIKQFRVLIGPCITKDCFETSIDIADLFQQKYFFSSEYIDFKLNSNGEKKSYIDLQSIICHQALDIGIPFDNIGKINLCTKCNQHLFFSYRGDNGNTGRMAAIFALDI